MFLLAPSKVVVSSYLETFVEKGRQSRRPIDHHQRAQEIKIADLVDEANAG